MNRLIHLVSIALVSSVGLQSVCVAQEINQPKSHMPNRIANKVTNVQLRAMLVEEESRKELDERGGIVNNVDTFGSFGFPELDVSGCSLNIGNTAYTGPASSLDKDVVIVGDVINNCR